MLSLNAKIRVFPDSTGKGETACGFTLIEIIMALTLLGVLGIFTAQYISQAARTTQLSSGMKDLVDEGKLAMEYMIRELRMADVDNIALTGSTTVTFDKVSTLEQDTDQTGIVFSWDSGTKTLTRTSDAGSFSLAGNLTGFSIAETPASSGIYIITMTLTGSEGETFALESGVRLRSKT